MYTLGIATSVAKHRHYSWAATLDFLTTHHLQTIQFYWQNPLPRLAPKSIKECQKIYLHLDEITGANFAGTLRGCREFSRYYSADAIIVHQQKSYVGTDLFTVISTLNSAGFTVGIENHDLKEPAEFKNTVIKARHRNYTIFIVLDIHKFFNRLIRKLSPEQILGAVQEMLRLGKQLNLTIVLHIIDSYSFTATRKKWCPIFAGIVPYTQIFDFMQREGILDAELILEYEEESMTVESIKRLRKFAGRPND
jgi:hypothetical protein